MRQPYSARAESPGRDVRAVDGSPTNAGKPRQGGLQPWIRCRRSFGFLKARATSPSSGRPPESIGSVVTTLPGGSESICSISSSSSNIT